MQEIMHSVGIDVGTTTTQVLFSRLVVENTASAVSVPKVNIVSREVIYKSPITFTPLIDRETIDAEQLRVVIEQEYARAGVAPVDIAAGAVIITGETARKRNAASVLHTLAGLAGEFVVTTAGSDLESLLAGRGAGTEQLSREQAGVFVNLDIGGGTTNYVMFRNGAPLDTTCLDIGGRHVRIDPQTLRILSISDQYKRLIASLHLPLAEGQIATLHDLRRLTDRCAELMAEMLRIVPPTPQMQALITNKDFRQTQPLAGVTFSGGVAESMRELTEKGITSNTLPATQAELFIHGDLGILLALSLNESPLFKRVPLIAARETIRATVVGVGVHIMELSGSTIFYSSAEPLPIKNIPVLKLAPEDEENPNLPSLLREKISWFQHDNKNITVAICLTGVHNPSYERVVSLAESLAKGCAEMAQQTGILVVIVENDLAKALGNALYNELNQQTALICLDSVTVENGDYIDLGKPVGGGRVLPVVVKSLLFGQ